MENIIKCDEKDYCMLAEIWERSVRATHKFLSEEVIAEIKRALIPDYFPNVDLYAIDADGVYAGFIGLRENKIEMLFIDSKWQGRGFGTKLIEFAKRNGVTLVDVNEQNVSALKFYQNQGFRIISRDDTDDAGRPYPILYMSL